MGFRGLFAQSIPHTGIDRRHGIGCRTGSVVFHPLRNDEIRDLGKAERRSTTAQEIMRHTKQVVTLCAQLHHAGLAHVVLRVQHLNHA